MTITCHCGNVICDQHGSLPDKARFVPDESWDATWETISQQILPKVTAGTLDSAAAYRVAYGLFHDVGRLVHQCSACGRVYIDDPKGGLQCYVPADAATEKCVLRGSRRSEG